jgi:DNA helicase INO80
MSDNLDTTPAATSVTPAKRGRGRGGGKAGSSKRAKTMKERLRLIDGDGGLA